MKGNTESAVAHDVVASDRVARDCIAKGLEGVKLELVAEAYSILKSAIRVSHDEMRTVFSEWNRGELADPLVAAAADVLGLRDEDGDPLLEKVLDVPRGSEACRGAASLALELGVPAPMASQAAFSSCVSRIKDERVYASAVLNGPKSAPTGDRHVMIEELRKALIAAFIIAYAEAHSLLAAAGGANAVAQGSALAARAAEARARCGPKESILLDAKVKSSLDPSLVSLRRICARCAEGGLHAPVLSAALAYYDGYRSTWLPSNMVVALRDALEGSGFERVDRPRGEVFHSEWK
jgi:6-phosphogluconate dehydrogenase